MASSKINNHKDIVKVQLEWSASIGTGLTTQQHTTNGELKTYLDNGYKVYAMSAYAAHPMYSYMLGAPVVVYPSGENPTAYIKAYNSTASAISDTIITVFTLVK